MIAAHAQGARRAALLIWAMLIASVSAWPFAGIGWIATTLALLPLLLPVPGFIRKAPRTLQWSSLTLAPALAFAVTELLVNSRARIPAALTLALIPAALAAIVALLRTIPRDA